MKSERILVTHPINTLRGEIAIPGDKSLSHRALIFAALSVGTSCFTNLLLSEDIYHLIEILRQLGAKISIESSVRPKVLVHGCGLNGLNLKRKILNLDCGNSGTALRLMAGVLAGQSFPSIIFGDVSLNKRPMLRIIKPLTLMGAKILGQQQNPQEHYAPLEFRPATLQGIHYELPVASAQVKSCIILAGLFANSSTVIVDPFKTRDHTERLLQQFGASLNVNGDTIFLDPTHSHLQAQSLAIPGDFSSAAFLIVLALIVPGSHIVLKNIGLNPTRTGLLKVLKQMGADIQIQNYHDTLEPFADLEVKASKLNAVFLDSSLIPSMIDEFPILFIAAIYAHGVSEFNGLLELRYKESDRIRSMSTALRKMGVNITEFHDGVKITGKNGDLEFVHGCSVDAKGDHRVAMALAVLFLASPVIGYIQDAENINTSFPSFCEILKNNLTFEMRSIWEPNKPSQSSRLMAQEDQVKEL